MFECVKMDDLNRDLFQDKLKNFEKLFSYPFGQDNFTIDHGENYFAFFERLGKADFFLALLEENIVAAVAVVIREVPFKKGGKLEEIAYLCDLKVHPEYRGKFLIQQLLSFAKGCQTFPNKVYAVSMDSKPFGFNRLLNITKRLPDISLALADHLCFYLLTVEELKKVEDLMHSYFGQFKFSSLTGIKDLILKSTGKPLSFLHFLPETASDSTVINEPQIGFQHMCCFPSGHPIIKQLAGREIRSFATASILQHNVSTNDWHFITTSDI